MPKADFFAGLSGAATAAAAGAFAGWWLQSRSRESDVEERARVRLRRWQIR